MTISTSSPKSLFARAKKRSRNVVTLGVHIAIVQLRRGTFIDIGTPRIFSDLPESTFTETGLGPRMNNGVGTDLPAVSSTLVLARVDNLSRRCNFYGDTFLVVVRVSLKILKAIAGKGTEEIGTCGYSKVACILVLLTFISIDTFKRAKVERNRLGEALIGLWQHCF
jgi:hypothetical protein